MKALLPILAAVLLLPACQGEPTAAETAAADAKALAQIEAAQHKYPPVQPLAPGQILPEDLERAGLLDAGCSFEAAGQTDPVIVARPQRAVMKLGRSLTSFASDPGSQKLPLGTWTHYVGKERSLRITAEGEGDIGSQKGLEWPARVTVTDQYDRLVFTSAGKLRCGA